MDDKNVDGAAYAMAVIYTLGYLGFMFLLLFHEIPQNNRELLLTLVGIMSAAEMGIIKYFYDGSRGAEKMQAANISRSAKNDTALQDIAKSIPLGTPILNDVVSQPEKPEEPK